MRRILSLLAALLAVMSAHANPPGGTPIDHPVEEVAHTLQSRLPALAMDGMCEVERAGNGWNFSIRVKAEAASADEVQVIVRAASASSSEVRIQGVRVEGSLISSKRKVDPQLSQEWKDRILALLGAPAAGG